MLDLLWQLAHGCSFLVTSRNFTAAKLGYANSYLKLRGPDHTTHLHRGGVNFVHNLLWLTGRFTPQPFVSGPIVALFNGEIYNYREFGWAHFVTDGEALIPMYRKHGELFARQLRGEFSLVVADFERDILVLSTDVFGTKPFWVARGAGEWGVASYASGLSRLDFGGHRMRATQELEPNTIEVRRLSTFRLLRRHTLHEFDLRQHKHALDDWTAAFRAAMARRAATLQHGVFVGLSAGVDSGLIALRLTEMQVAHHLYSLDCHEQTSTIHRRHKFARAASRQNQPHGVETLSKETYQAALAWMDAHVEPFQYTQVRRRGIQLAHDPGAVGLSYICSQAKAAGLRVYLSGAGADEVYGDYGRIRAWPANLSEVWPWPSFFHQEMRDYLRKEEYVAGAWGIEGRYPFLDADLVQEFLSLNTTLKAQATKYPLLSYMRDAGYPIANDKKRGFWKLDWERWAKHWRQARVRNATRSTLML